MPRKPPTDRWWPRKATRSLEEVWSELSVEHWQPLVAAEVAGRAPRNALSTPLLDEDSEDALFECVSCYTWDAAAFDRPAIVTVRRESRRGDAITPRDLRNLWITTPIGTWIPLFHTRLLEALEPDLDGDWLIGDVFFDDGTPLESHKSVIDPRPLGDRVRRGYVSGGHIGFDECTPCEHCGRLRGFAFGTAGRPYLLESDVLARGPSSDRGRAYLPKRVVDRLDLHNRREWPLSRVSPIHVFTEVVDPFPNPLAETWEALERYLSGRDRVLPFPRFTVGRSEPLPVWLREQVARRGEDIIAFTDDNIPGGHIATMDRFVLTLRLRALLEPRVREFIDGKSDDDLIEAIKIHRRTFRDGGLPV